MYYPMPPTESKPSIVFLSTYPPRECGIATFTQDLLDFCAKFLGTSVSCKVAAFNLTPLDTYNYPKEVAWKIDQNSKKEHVRLAKTINNDVNVIGVIVQHEYGIFGGTEGRKILYFMQNCKKPMLVTLHTVLPHPTADMKAVTREIVKLARNIVVLTDQSRKIVEELYPEAGGKISVIPHGIHQTLFATPEKYKAKLGLKNRTVLSTFGLLSRGKGIGYVIKALPPVIKKYPSLLYLVLGETHPVVQRKEGEKYRIELIKLVNKLGLQKHVKFYDQYLSLPHLFAFLKATDIYISSSTNPNQAVSGTLSYALGAGRAVISTQFAQAKEIVTSDIGKLVAIKDSPGVTAALLDLLSDKKRLNQMHLNAYNKTRPMLWSNVAKRYVNLLTQTAIPPLHLNHLLRMTDEFGLFQFASGINPDKDFGYTLDDNARALIVCSWLIKQSYTKELENLIHIYFGFIQKCFTTDGSFINYIGYENKLPTAQNNKENLEDAQGRALWALGEIISNTELPQTLRDQAKKIFLLALKKGSQLAFIRSRAFAIKAFSLALTVLPEYREELTGYINKYADSLVQSFELYSQQKTWTWFEDTLSYSNGLLPESLFIAGNITKNTEYNEKAKMSLDFLIKETFSSHMYRPIGNSAWYVNAQKRSDYDQQPEDPSSMISALVCAYKITGDEEYKRKAKICFSWFLGNNSEKLPMYDEKSGGCFDGLRPGHMNPNEGAESLVMYLMACFLIKQV